MNDKKTSPIVIRINGKEQILSSVGERDDGQVTSKIENDEQVQAEVSHIEQIEAKVEAMKEQNEQKAEDEVASTVKEDENQPFSWIVSKPVEEKDKIVSIKEYKKERIKRAIPSIFLAQKDDIKKMAHREVNPKRFQPIVAILLALFVGISFGLFMLNVVNNNSNASATPQTIVPAMIDNPFSSSNSKDVKLSKLTVYILQQGVYSTKGKAEQAMEKEDAPPFTVVKTDEGYRTLLGVVGKEDVAKQLQKELQSFGWPTYLKEIVVNERKWEASSKEEKKAIDSLVVLMKLQIQEATVLLNGDTITKENKKQLSSLLTMLQSNEKLFNGNLNGVYVQITKLQELLLSEKTDAVAIQNETSRLFSLYYTNMKK